jgi:hypothetical protein
MVVIYVFASVLHSIVRNVPNKDSIFNLTSLLPTL